MPKVIIGLIVVLLVAYVVAYPTQAADLVHHGWGQTKNVAGGLGDFVNKLAG